MRGTNRRRKRRFSFIRTVFSRFFHIAELRQLWGELGSYYAGRVSHPQDRKAILLTYFIGGLLVVASGTILLAPFTLPFLLGYYKREMYQIIHAEQPATILRRPFDPHRPSFSDSRNLAVDGLKLAVIGLGYLLFLVIIGSIPIALLDLLGRPLSLSEPFTNGVVNGWLVVMGVAGFYVVPFFLARFSHTGRLAGTVSLSGSAFWWGLFNRWYVLGFIFGSITLFVMSVLIGVLAMRSVIVALLVVFPTVFVLTLLAVDFFAVGYRKSLGIEARDAVPEAGTDTADTDGPDGSETEQTGSNGINPMLDQPMDDFARNLSALLAEAEQDDLDRSEVGDLLERFASEVRQGYTDLPEQRGDWWSDVHEENEGDQSE